MMNSTRTSTAQEIYFCGVMREYTSNPSGGTILHGAAWKGNVTLAS